MSYLKIMHYKFILMWLYMRVITIKMKIATVDIYTKLTVENLHITWILKNSLHITWISKISVHITQISKISLHIKWILKISLHITWILKISYLAKRWHDSNFRMIHLNQSRILTGNSIRPFTFSIFASSMTWGRSSAGTLTWKTYLVTDSNICKRGLWHKATKDQFPTQKTWCHTIIMQWISHKSWGDIHRGNSIFSASLTMKRWNSISITS